MRDRLPDLAEVRRLSRRTLGAIEKLARPPRRAATQPALSWLALAAGAFAVGAVAVGALAIGRLAIGRMVLGRARVRYLEVDELVVGKLHVEERSGPGGKIA